jgi:hypothetical protein
VALGLVEVFDAVDEVVVQLDASQGKLHHDIIRIASKYSQLSRGVGLRFSRTEWKD